MKRESDGRRPEPLTFGEGQNGGELLDIEQGGRHGQPEKGDSNRMPKQGGAGYQTPPARGRTKVTKKK